MRNWSQQLSMTLAGPSFQPSFSLNSNISLIQNGRKADKPKGTSRPGENYPLQVDSIWICFLMKVNFGVFTCFHKETRKWYISYTHKPHTHMQIHTYTPNSDLQASIRNPEIQKVLKNWRPFCTLLGNKIWSELNSFGGKTWPKLTWSYL